MRRVLGLLIFLGAVSAQSQIVSLNPSDAGPDDQATLIFDATEGGGELMGLDKVYIHHGIITDSPTSEEWEYTIGNWGQDNGVGQMTKVNGEDDKWEIVMSPSIREYFGAQSGESIFRISAVFRSADGNTKATLASGNYDWGTVAGNGDFFIDLNVENFITLDNPTSSIVAIKDGETLPISASASSSVTSMKILIDNGSGFQEYQSISSGTSISYEYTPTEQQESLTIRITATVGGEQLELNFDVDVYVVEDSPVATIPTGLKKGINYHSEDATRVSLVLEAPGKDYVYVTGDFNEWDLANASYLMNVTPDGELFWFELNGLTPGQDHLFQYSVNGEVLVADPYSEQIADPWNDQWIAEETYPNLPEYTRQEYGPATVIRTNQTPYQWAPSEDSWIKPDQDHMVIYELLVRDFIGTHSYKELADTLPYLKSLGIDAIELMPINEFEGNESWGYNPMMYFAPDKYYGTKEELKFFIERAHQEGMAVIIDMVLNHAYGSNPMVQMYFNDQTYKVTPDNPWFNEEYVTANSDWAWGYDFNHESEYTKAFVDSVNTYWIKEYHVDGFRFDFTKGFTQNPNSTSFNGYDESRINILKRMADKIWEADPDTYVILEHFAAGSEENELANYGMKLWRNKVGDFHEVVSGRDLNRSFQGSDDLSHVVFLGSHDEQRIGYYPPNNGASSNDGAYNISDELIGFERLKQIAAFALLNPGPKMIWQFDELGYDIDINFNGRVGNKPLPWGDNGLGYYENPMRQHIYSAYQGILDVRRQIGPDKMNSASTSHRLFSESRRLVYNTDDIDLVVIANFGLSDLPIDPSFTETGSWFDYFSGEEIMVSNVNAEISLAQGEWHLYTSERISDGLPGVVETFQNPVTVSPFPFTQEDEITITFDATKASPDGTNGLEGKDKVYMHSGVYLVGESTDQWSNVVGNLADDGVGEMTETSEGIWEITLTPEDYYSLADGEEIIEILMYFRDAQNVDLGKGFRGQNISLKVELAGPHVIIEPAAFQVTDEITVTFNAGKGNRELLNASKVYMHSSVDFVESETPWLTAWENVVGNWGMDDGVGLMTKSTEDPTKWSITLTPSDYYGLQPGDRVRWLAAVFRNADGTQKGTGSQGEMENGIIDPNLDFFIRNQFVYPLSANDTVTRNYRVYPNPTKNELTVVRATGGRYTYKILDISGKSISQGSSQGEVIIDVTNLNRGMYFLQLIDNQKEVIRFIKE